MSFLDVPSQATNLPHHIRTNLLSRYSKHFTETVDGLLTIRAFNWVAASIDLNMKLLDESQQASYLLPMLQQWLNMVLNLCVAGIAVIFITLATQLRTKAGFTGVGLVSLMSFGEMTSNLIRLYADLQTSTVALSRLGAFESQVPAEDDNRQVTAIEKAWPHSGDLRMNNVSASYG